VGKKSLCPETHFFSYKRYFLKKLILYKGKRKIWASGQTYNLANLEVER
jgi:hypothetical protein